MSGGFYLDDIDLTKMFIDEWTECLEGLEKEILKLEVHSDDSELLNDIFRRVHSIKGGSSFVGLSGITRLSHEIEFTLDAIRKKKVSVNMELIDSLLQAVDFLNGYISRIYNKLKEYDSSGGNGTIYIEFGEEEKEKSVLEGLRQALEKRENNDEEDGKTGETGGQEDAELGLLQTEEFKSKLAEELKEQFLLENTEHIDRIENQLLIQLESSGNDKDAVLEMFRSIHSIKGGIGFYLATISNQSPYYPTLKGFSEVVHTFESLLALVRDRGLTYGNKLIDLSYEVMDYLKTSMNAVASEECNDVPTAHILDKIERFLSNLQSVSGNDTESYAKTLRPEPGKIADMQQKSNIMQSIRVSQEKLDKMMNMISELLIAKNTFMHIASRLNLDYNLPEMSKEVKEVGAYINRISDDLQNAIMSIRMVEIKTIFQRMPRVVRDISQSTGKKMELIMEGEDTEIDKTIIEQISDPLVHLIRNAADHGIEAPEERLSKGKNETGRIVLRAYNKNKHVYIEIEDDGKGIDAESLKKKAIEKGFITKAEAESMSRGQLINLIFLPGFSTAKQITEVSGRGVGMDIVKSNIEKINGNITIESEVDKGTKMIIQLPLTLAVSRGLTVEASGETYIFPLEYIVETVKISRNNIHTFNDKYFTHLRGDVIGVEWLSRIFLTGRCDDEKEELNAVIISNGAEKYAIIVDKLKSEQEFVVKTLDGHLSSIPGISGSTLLGNGRVVLIVNPADIIQLAQK
ncbi:MAG TPA: chemotaxis protein CheA [Clostridiaceae bacterium]|nr:chemotaxis protein CheA [Clostridiaceae bacterium]